MAGTGHNCARRAACLEVSILFTEAPRINNASGANKEVILFTRFQFIFLQVCCRENHYFYAIAKSPKPGQF